MLEPKSILTECQQKSIAKSEVLLLTLYIDNSQKLSHNKQISTTIPYAITELRRVLLQEKVWVL